jgi:hypothetical protein
MSTNHPHHASPDPSIKLSALRKISTLANWRFQLLSQPIILDRAHRRPFKLTRGPLPFVATDMGSGIYARETDLSSSVESGKSGTKMPPELRKRLQEIGWVDERLEWRARPMRLLPIYQIDKAEAGAAAGEGTPTSPGGGCRTGSGDGSRRGIVTQTVDFGRDGMKRRAVFVPALAALFIDIASLAFDPHFAVASAARDLITDLMRNELALVTRPGSASGRVRRRFGASRHPARARVPPFRDGALCTQQPGSVNTSA